MGLSREERECILTYNDADGTWSVYSDSHLFRAKTRKWLEHLGVSVKKTQFGFEAEGIPRWAVGFRQVKGRGQTPTQASLDALSAATRQKRS